MKNATLETSEKCVSRVSDLVRKRFVVHQDGDLIKVDDKRNYKLPTFEESKNNVRAGLIQKKQADLIVQLRKSAKIQ